MDHPSQYVANQLEPSTPLGQQHTTNVNSECSTPLIEQHAANNANSEPLQKCIPIKPSRKAVNILSSSQINQAGLIDPNIVIKNIPIIAHSVECQLSLKGWQASPILVMMC